MKFLSMTSRFHSRRCGPQGYGVRRGRSGGGPGHCGRDHERGWGKPAPGVEGHRAAAAHHRRPGWGLAGTGQRPGDPVARVGLRGRSFADLIRKVRGLHARRHRGPDHRSHPDHGPENDKLLRGQPKLFGPGHDGRAGASRHPGHPGGP